MGKLIKISKDDDEVVWTIICWTADLQIWKNVLSNLTGRISFSIYSDDWMTFVVLMYVECMSWSNEKQYFIIIQCNKLTCYIYIYIYIYISRYYFISSIRTIINHILILKCSFVRNNYVANIKRWIFVSCKGQNHEGQNAFIFCSCSSLWGCQLFLLMFTHLYLKFFHSIECSRLKRIFYPFERWTSIDTVWIWIVILAQNIKTMSFEEMCFREYIDSCNMITIMEPTQHL